MVVVVVVVVVVLTIMMLLLLLLLLLMMMMMMMMIVKRLNTTIIDFTPPVFFRFAVFAGHGELLTPSTQPICITINLRRRPPPLS